MTICPNEPGIFGSPSSIKSRLERLNTGDLTALQNVYCVSEESMEGFISRCRERYLETAGERAPEAIREAVQKLEDLKRELLRQTANR